MMIRTQVYLPKSLYRDLRLTALKDKKPTAQVLREALVAGLEEIKMNTKPDGGLLDLDKMAVKTGDKNLSKNIDKYLYADKS